MTYVERLEGGESDEFGSHHHHHFTYSHPHAHDANSQAHNPLKDTDTPGSEHCRNGVEEHATDPMSEPMTVTKPKYGIDDSSSASTSEFTTLLHDSALPLSAAPHPNTEPQSPHDLSDTGIRRYKSYSSISPRKITHPGRAATDGCLLSSEPFFSGHHRYELPVTHPIHSSHGWRIHFCNIRDAVLRFVPNRNTAPSGSNDESSALFQRAEGRDVAQEGTTLNGDEANLHSRTESSFGTHLERRKQVISILVCQYLACRPSH